MFLGLFFLYNNCIAISAWTEAWPWPCVPHPCTVHTQQKHSWSNDTTATVDGQHLHFFIRGEGREKNHDNVWDQSPQLTKHRSTDTRYTHTHSGRLCWMKWDCFVNLQIPINQWQFQFQSLLRQANILPWINKPDCTPKIPVTTALRTQYSNAMQYALIKCLFLWIQ